MPVEVAGRSWVLPPGTVVTGRTDGAVTAELPVPFWTALYPAAAPATGWQKLGRSRLLLLTRPDGAHPWDAGATPPVPGPVAPDVMRDGVRVWRDLSPSAGVPRLFLTYDGRSDLYVRCDARQIWNFEQSCDLVGNDAGVLAVFPIYGNRVAVAPAVLDAFRRATGPGS